MQILADAPTTTIETTNLDLTSHQYSPTYAESGTSDEPLSNTPQSPVLTTEEQVEESQSKSRPDFNLFPYPVSTVSLGLYSTTEVCFGIL